MSDNVDDIFNEIVSNHYDKVSELNALIMEAKDLTAQYEYIRQDIVDIYTDSSVDDTKILQLHENFARLLRNINSINKELFSIISNKPNHKTAE